jgi:hypothetical protein
MSYITYRNFRTKKTLENGKDVFDVDGAITACCEVFPEENKIHVGFSLLNPTDSQIKIRGKGLAKQRMINNPIVLNDVEMGEKGKLKVSEKLREYVKEAMHNSKGAAKIFDHFHIPKYNGDSMKCGVLKWLPLMLSKM